MPHCISPEKAGMAKGPALKHSCGDTAPCSYLHLLSFIIFWPFTDLTGTTSPKSIFIYSLLSNRMISWWGQSQNWKGREQEAARDLWEGEPALPMGREHEAAETLVNTEHLSRSAALLEQIFFFLNNANNPTAFQFLIWLFHPCQQQA